MEPEHARSFAGGAADTTLSPVVLIAMAIAIILILMLPRKYVMVPLAFILFLVPMGQQVLLGGFHFYTFRIIILIGLSRMIFTKMSAQEEIIPGGLCTVDRAYLWCLLSMAGASILLFLNSTVVFNQVGFLVDYLGGYFLVRFLIQGEEDIYRFIKCLAVIAFIASIAMVRELFTQQNIFGLIGGASTPEMREGRVRCQGPFAHALMAGAFGSTLLPICYLLWKNGKAKALAGIGMLAAVLITWTSNSSTALMSFSAGLFAICLWPIRKSMRTVRWGIVIGLAALQLVMKAPIWFLIARVDLTGGSSSYHRAELINEFVNHFFDWWLIGVKGSGSWGLDMWDVQNQFVNVGETGGLIALVLFITVICLCFSMLGKARKAIEGDSAKEWFVWLLGAALFSNVVAFVGVNYFDQMKFDWFALLSMILAATIPILKTSKAEELQPVKSFRRFPAAYSPTPATGSIASKANLKTSAQLNPRLRS